MRLGGRSSGFTLIELLVVIAIIAILAAILFPVFTTAKERGRQVRCLNNLRQLATSITMYCNDYGGRLPNARVCMSKPSWEGCQDVGKQVFVEQGQVFKYVKNKALYMCPTDWRRPAKAAGYEKDYPLSYSMNTDFYNVRSSLAPIGPIKLDVIRRPREVLMLIHEHRDRINDGDFNWRAEHDIPSNVHYDGTTVVYTDAHAKWQSFLEMKACKSQSTWDPLK